MYVLDSNQKYSRFTGQVVLHILYKGFVSKPRFIPCLQYWLPIICLMWDIVHDFAFFFKQLNFFYACWLIPPADWESLNIFNILSRPSVHFLCCEAACFHFSVARQTKCCLPPKCCPSLPSTVFRAGDPDYLLWPGKGWPGLALLGPTQQDPSHCPHQSGTIE